MNNPLFKFLPSSRIGRVLLFLVALAHTSVFVSAASFYWDTNGATVGAGTTPTGLWTITNTTNNWSTDPTGASITSNWVSSNVSDAFFSAGTDAVSLANITTTTTSVGNITINNGIYNFTNGGALSLGTSAGANITMGASAGATTFNGTVNLLSNTTNANIIQNSNSLLTFNGAVAMNNMLAGTTTTNIVITGTGTGGVTFNGVMQTNNTSNANASANLLISGGGVVTLGASNLMPGNTILSAGGSLTLANTNALNMSTLIQNGGTFSFGNLTTANINGIAGNSSIALTNASSAAVNLTIARNGFLSGGNFKSGTNNPIFNGSLSGSGSLTVNSVPNGAGTASILPGTQTLAGTNTYTGATLVTGDTLQLGSNTVSSGSILNTSNIMVTGIGNIILNNAAGVADRITDTQTVTLQQAGNLGLIGNATSSITETIGTLELLNGHDIVTATSGGGAFVTKLTASNLSRLNQSTALIRGTNLGGVATNVGQFTLASTAGLTQVGTNTSSSGLNTGTDKLLKIVPFLIGDISPTGNGSNFVTYDTTSGFRTLGTNEQTSLTAGYVTAATPENVKTTGLTLTNSAITVNSLLLNSTGTLNGTMTTLTVNSGAVAMVGNTTTTIGSGISNLILGNGTVNEGVVTVALGSNSTIASAVNVTGSGTLIKAGNGNLTLNGANLYTGGTLINGGILQIGDNTTGSLNSSGNITITTGSTLSVALADGGTIANNIINNGTISKPFATNTTLSGNISGSGGITLNTLNSNLNLSGNNSYLGNTTVTNGTLSLGSNTALSTTALNISNSTLQATSAVNRTLANNISLTNNATIGSTGNLTLANLTSGNFALTVNASTFSLTNNLTLTTGSGNFTKAGTGSLLVRGNYTGVSNSNITVTTGMLGIAGTATGNMTYYLNNGGVLGRSGTITAGLGTGNQNMSLSGGGSAGFAAYGSNSSWSSTNNALFNIGGSNASITWGAANFLASGSTLILGNANSNGMVTIGNPLNLNSAAQTIQVDRSGLSGALVDATLSNSITSGSLTKTGTGVLALTNNFNTFTGLTLNGGTTLINNAVNSGSGSGAVTVNSGAVLGGTGIIVPTGTAVVTVASGGSIAPGAITNTPSNLQFDGGSTSGALLTMASGATFTFTLGASNTSDLISIYNFMGGDLVLNSNVVNFTNAQVGTFKLFDFYSDFGGTLTAHGLSSGLVLGTGLGGLSGNLVYNTNDISLNVVAVPEPSTYLMLLGGLLMLLMVIRRKTSRVTDH